MSSGHYCNVEISPCDPGGYAALPLVRIGRVPSCGTATEFKNDVPQISLLLKAFLCTGIQSLCKCTPVFPTLESILSYVKIIKERQKRGESQSMLEQERRTKYIQVI